MNPLHLSVLAAAALALAGCTAPAQEPGPSPTTTAPAAGEGGAAGSPAQGGPSSAAGAAPGPSPAEAPGSILLHFTPDLAFALEPPAAAARVPIGEAVNSPLAGDYPSWSGELPRAVRVPESGLELVFHVAADAPSLAAGTVPLWGPLGGPDHLYGFYIAFRLGEALYEAQLDGPPVLLPGEVATLRAALLGPPGTYPAGTEVQYDATITYTHVAGAAEFHYLLGPDHPMAVAFP